MSQDFSKRIAIVIDKNLPSWQVLNTVAHISAYLGNKMRDQFDTGTYFDTQDNVHHPRNSQYPIIIFSAEKNELSLFAERVRASGLLYLGFIREMIETTNDEELEKILSAKPDKEIEYLGIGVFGSDEIVKPLFKKFSLWK